jgi:hypothetical protein
MLPCKVGENDDWLKTLYSKCYVALAMNQAEASFPFIMNGKEASALYDMMLSWYISFLTKH